jgi:hypothetical protein
MGVRTGLLQFEDTDDTTAGLAVWVAGSQQASVRVCPRQCWRRPAHRSLREASQVHLHESDDTHHKHTLRTEFNDWISVYHVEFLPWLSRTSAIGGSVLTTRAVHVAAWRTALAEQNSIVVVHVWCVCARATQCGEVYIPRLIWSEKTLVCKSISIKDFEIKIHEGFIPGLVHRCLTFLFDVSSVAPNVS